MSISDLARRIARLARHGRQPVEVMRWGGLFPGEQDYDAEAPGSALRWHREPGEPEAAFERRVIAEAEREGARCVLIWHFDG